MDDHDRLRQALVQGDGEYFEGRLLDGHGPFVFDDGLTPLEVAVLEIRSPEIRRETVRQLLDGGLDPNQTFEALLSLGVRTGDLPLVELLIMAGAEIRSSDLAEDPLTEAAARGDDAMVDLLFQAFEVSDFDLMGALWSAASEGQIEMFRRLERLAEASDSIDRARDRLRQVRRVATNPHHHPRAGELLKAIEEADHPAVKELLASGVPAQTFVVQWNHLPTSALRRAASLGDAPSVRLLLQAGASIDGLVDGEGRLEESTPLIDAIRTGAYGLARRLVALGADVKQMRNDGAGGLQGPLLQLLSYGIGEPRREPVSEALPLIHALWKAGDDLEAKDADGKTALFWAALRPVPEALKTLLSLGARPDPLDREGNAAATHAFYRLALSQDAGKRKAYRAILDALGPPVPHQREAELMAAAFRGDLARCRRCLEQGADVNHPIDGWPALRTARAGRQKETEALLLAAGAQD